MIQVRYDSQRGCGWRKPGGLYLISMGEGRGCGMPPLPLTVCPTCSQGIKPTRGFTWIDVEKLLADRACRMKGDPVCLECPFRAGLRVGRIGMIWVGESFYPTPHDFVREAAFQGISRRVAHLPREFKIGETWVGFAHRKAITTWEDGEPVYTPGLFYLAKPDAVEYVVKGTETDEEIERMEKRGITPVEVRKRGEQTEFEEA